MIALNLHYTNVGITIFKVAKQSFLTELHDIISLKECCTLDSHRFKAGDHCKSNAYMLPKPHTVCP